MSYGAPLLARFAQGEASACTRINECGVKEKLQADSPTACELVEHIPTNPKPELNRRKARKVHMTVIF